MQWLTKWAQNVLIYGGTFALKNFCQIQNYDTLLVMSSGTHGNYPHLSSVIITETARR